MHATKRGPTANRLLSALPAKTLKQMLANCEAVDLQLADVLSRPGKPIAHVYFPTDSFISLLAPIDGHGGLEVGMIGNEGMFGAGLILGVDASPLSALVQGAGTALRMTASRFRRELDESPALRVRLNRYVHVLLNQLAQTAACTRFHLLEARLARWLLMTRDRAHSEEFYLTHDFLSHMLGVQRVGVTRAASSLQRRKLITYTRGVLKVLDRGGLQAAACTCYRVDKKIYERTLG